MAAAGEMVSPKEALLWAIYWGAGLMFLYVILVGLWGGLKEAPSFIAELKQNRSMLMEYRMKHAFSQVVGDNIVFLMPDVGVRIIGTDADWDTLFDKSKESAYTH